MRNSANEGTHQQTKSIKAGSRVGFTLRITVPEFSSYLKTETSLGSFRGLLEGLGFYEVNVSRKQGDVIAEMNVPTAFADIQDIAEYILDMAEAVGYSPRNITYRITLLRLGGAPYSSVERI